MAIMQQTAEDCLHMLCERGANLNARLESHCRQTALHLAVSHQAPSAVAILVSPGADVNITELSCIEVLLERGASSDAMNAASRTPLHEACHGGREDVAELLLKYGADLNKCTRSGENCLFLFLSQSCNLKNTGLLGKLLGLESPLSVVNTQGHLPLVLTLPCYSRQKDHLVRLSKQPRDLLAICKIHLVQCHKDSCRPILKEILPEKIYNFVFHQWDCLLDVEFNDTHERQALFPLTFEPNLPYWPRLPQQPSA